MARVLVAIFTLCSSTVVVAGDGLPPVPVPDGNPITANKAILGKLLFWEEQLSSDGTTACGTCHRPAFGGADPRLGAHPGPDGIFGFVHPKTGIDDLFGSPGVIRADSAGNYVPDATFNLGVQVTGRSANTAIFAMYAQDIFWDGRATDVFINPETGATSLPSGGALESQAVVPILSVVEMAQEGRTWSDVVSRLQTVTPMALATNLPADLVTALLSEPSYPDLFADAFGSSEITAEKIGFSIATYERTLVPDQTPFDLGTMSVDQQQGLELLTKHTVCLNCHVPPQFTDNLYYNIGLRPSEEDLGRREITDNDVDRGRFKTPTLRNSGLKSSLMHIGWVTDLQDSIDYYNQENGHFQFTDDQDSIPPGGGIYANIDMPAEVGDPPIPFQARVIDFIANGLTDPRVAAETAPFDRPTLHSESKPANPLVTVGSSPGTDGIAPRIIAVTPPNLGNGVFRIGVMDGLGGADAILALSSDPPVNGVLINPDELHGPFSLAGNGAGNGYMTWHWPIDEDPTLIDSTLYVQWFIDDPEGMEGVSRSEVAEFTIFCLRACPETVQCPADLDGDGEVGGSDLTILLASWGACSGCPADFNGDGIVNGGDMTVLLGSWGSCQ